MAKLQLPSMSEMFQQRRTARDLVTELDSEGGGFRSQSVRPPSMPAPMGRQADVSDILGKINAFLEQNFVEGQMSAPTPKYEVGEELPEPPAYFDAEGRREWWRILADATRAERQALAIPNNQRTGVMGLLPGSMEPTRTQPSGTTGYYTNETGTFYHLRGGDRYYDD